MKRPDGSNADEWCLFLEVYRGADQYIAVQIAEAIEARGLAPSGWFLLATLLLTAGAVIGKLICLYTAG